MSDKTGGRRVHVRMFSELRPKTCNLAILMESFKQKHILSSIRGRNVNQNITITLLEIFCKIIFNSEVIFKSVIDPDNNFKRNLKELMVSFILANHRSITGV